MRAVCTRGRFEGGWEQPTLARVCVCVCAHTRRVEDPSSFSLRATAERIHPRAKKLYYFGGKILFFDPPPILLLSRLLFFSFPPSFFQTDHPLFRTARASPPERGGNRGRERGEKPQLSFAQPRFSARLVIISLVIILCVHFAVFVVAVVQLRSL